MSNRWNLDDSKDALHAAPDSHKVILENENVRVIEVTIKPNHKEPSHTHKWPSVMIVNSAAKINYFDEKGKKTKYPKRDISPKNPLIEYLKPEKSHSVENIDDIPYHAYRIEIKKSPLT